MLISNLPHATYPRQGFLDLLSRRLLREGRTVDLSYIAQTAEALNRLQQMITNSNVSSVAPIPAVWAWICIWPMASPRRMAAR